MFVCIIYYKNDNNPEKANLINIIIFYINFIIFIYKLQKLIRTTSKQNYILLEKSDNFLKYLNLIISSES